MRAHIITTLNAAGLPRAIYEGTPFGAPRWTFGWGLSTNDDHVIVWCNPGSLSQDGWRRSAMLGRRVHESLTLAGYRTYRDETRNPQQVIVLAPPRAPKVSGFTKSRTASALGVALALTYVFTGAGAPLLLAAVCLIPALMWGRAAERQTVQGVPGRLMKGNRS